MFYLVRLDRDGDGNLVETPLPDFGTFEKGADAAKASKTAAAALSGAKVQCRRIAQASDWRGTMAKRLEDGQLNRLPEAWDLPPIEDHFAHLHAPEPSLIGFIDSNENGIINRVTALTPGRYLTRFYPHVDDNRRRHLIAAIDPSGEVYFATTEDDIAFVYENGPESCMDGQHGFENLPIWPPASYGAGDLAVAYTKNKDGRIQSRCVCWPEKKLFGRCYGDFQRMKAAMEAEGYTWIRTDNTALGNNKVESFIGARLLKIPAKLGNPGEYVMPYFDDIKVAVDMGDHFVTAEKGEPGKVFITSGGSSSGTTELKRFCEKSESAVPACTAKFVHGVNQWWGDAAIHTHAFTCNATGTLWPRDEMVVMGHGVQWSSEYANEHAERCEVTRRYWPKDQMVQRGNKRVHLSAAHRFDENGEELACAPPPKTRADMVADSMKSHDWREYALNERRVLDSISPRSGHLFNAADLILSIPRRVA
jgi:hypothetical protein